MECVMSAVIVTRESLQKMLSDSNQEYIKQVIGRALVVLFNNQTDSEKAVNSTVVHNDTGFTGADAHSGTLTAKYFLKHRTLADWQVENWKKLEKSGFSRITKYHRQLNEAAMLKAKKSA